jgi:hypothetical protein
MTFVSQVTADLALFNSEIERNPDDLPERLRIYREIAKLKEALDTFSATQGLATKTDYSGPNTGTTTVIVTDAAVPADQEIAITYLSIQNATIDETLVLVESGESSQTEKKRVRTLGKITGIAESYGPGNELAMDPGEGLVISIDMDKDHDITCRYYLRDSVTKLPV